ncbi:MAG TPA: SMC-Scp complex subunit ScpB [Bryobacteraceae bacterium]|nr:SMC-Scp complex subunit ScpB [Bryobacteraceae bacterium]
MNEQDPAADAQQAVIEENEDEIVAELQQTAVDENGQAPARDDAHQEMTDEQPVPDPAHQQPVDITPEQLLIDVAPEAEGDAEVARKLAILEAVVYVTDEPLSPEQIAKALGEPLTDVKLLLDRLVEEYNRPHHGLTVREVAGGFKITTKPEHHEAVRTFVRNLNPPLKLSLAALETLAVIAYKQPITAPEIMEIRGVQGAGVLKTLIDRKLITTAGRKNVVGKPILYKTTKEFLVQFGLRDLNELPSLKEFEDLRRMAFAEADESVAPADVVDGEPVLETNGGEPASEEREEQANHS